MRAWWVDSPSGSQNTRFRFKVAVLAAPLLMLTVLVGMKLTSPELYWRFAAAEDGPVEYLTSINYFLAAGLFASICAGFSAERQRRLTLLVGLLAAGCAFVALEEISWGQRLFGVSTPLALRELNNQEELNLHNLAGRYLLHAAFIIAGAYGAFAFVLVRRWAPDWKGASRALLVPPWWLATYFLPVFLLYTYYDYLSPVLVRVFGETWGWEFGQGHERFIIAKDQESVECLMSLGVALLAATNKMRQRAGLFNGRVGA